MAKRSKSKKQPKIEFKVKRISKTCKLPERKSKGAAGYDLYSNENYLLKKGERKAFDLGLSFCIPEGYYGRIAPRSGLSKTGIDIGAGVIDSDYTGSVSVLLINNGENDFLVTAGERIAQLLLENIITPELKEVEELEETERGEKGFGSTGTN